MQRLLAFGLLAAGLLLTSAGNVAAQPASFTAPVSAAAMAKYHRDLKTYLEAREQFEQQAETYWKSIAAKRHNRNRKRRDHDAILLDDYVTTQPPRYAGPAEPVNPAAPTKKLPPPPRKYVPVVADFLASAKTYFHFVPEQPKSEIAFKRAYAQVAASAGLTRDQVVRIYAFECGGNGTYDLQAGQEYSKRARVISTALGYNQLLHVNSLELMAEQGDDFIAVLAAKAATLSGEAKAALLHKIAVMRRMIAFARTVPDRWQAHKVLADTKKGWGLHALNLDVDVAPLLQTQKLRDSLAFARRKGYAAPLTAAELEMMNLTGDGNGFDMVTMPHALRAKVPTANFFHRRGYERNRVAIRNNVVAALLAATNATMDRESKQRGARDMAAAYPQ